MWCAKSPLFFFACGKANAKGYAYAFYTVQMHYVEKNAIQRDIQTMQNKWERICSLNYPPPKCIGFTPPSDNLREKKMER
jgi:hypothetical protein